MGNVVSEVRMPQLNDDETVWLYESICADVKRGRTVEEIIAPLVASGWSEEDARTAVANARASRTAALQQSPVGIKGYRRAGSMGRAVLGGGFLALGLGASVYSYVTARPGGYYVMFGGMIVAGAALLLTGLGDRWAK